MVGHLDGISSMFNARLLLFQIFLFDKVSFSRCFCVIAFTAIHSTRFIYVLFAAIALNSVNVYPDFCSFLMWCISLFSFPTPKASCSPKASFVKRFECKRLLKVCHGIINSQLATFVLIF